MSGDVGSSEFQVEFQYFDRANWKRYKAIVWYQWQPLVVKKATFELLLHIIAFIFVTKLAIQEAVQHFNFLYAHDIATQFLRNFTKITWKP